MIAKEIGRIFFSGHEYGFGRIRGFSWSSIFSGINWYLIGSGIEVIFQQELLGILDAVVNILSEFNSVMHNPTCKITFNPREFFAIQFVRLYKRFI